MKPSLVVFLAAALPLVAACSKFETKKAAKADPSASQETTPPRRNAAESLGIASGSAEDYMQPNESPKPAESPTAPSPSATEPAASAAPVSASAVPDASKPGIRRTLTATDGRTVEAELLAKSEAAVKIRRAADAQEFTIPLERISEADRNFVRESQLPPLAAR